MKTSIQAKETLTRTSVVPHWHQCERGSSKKISASWIFFNFNQQLSQTSQFFYILSFSVRYIFCRCCIRCSKHKCTSHSIHTMPFQALYIKNNGAKVQEIHANTHSQHIRFEDEIKQKHTRKRKILCCVVLKMRINFMLFVLLSF